MARFTHTSVIPASPDTVFDWHSRPGAFHRLIPPWQGVELLKEHESFTDGVRMSFLMPILGPIASKWVAEISNVKPGEGFHDAQIRGPFAHWLHKHHMARDGQSDCRLTDEIEFALPRGRFIPGPIRRLIESSITSQLTNAFRFRHQQTRHDLEHHRKHSETSMIIAITGASGLVGQSLQALLTTGGHTVRCLTRRSHDLGEGEFHWDPTAGHIDDAALDGVDAVVHLAGENVGEGRWTKAKKARILDSRMAGTRLVAESLASRGSSGASLISASAIGYYGDRGDELLTEDSPAGTGFLADVCREWENATDPAAEAGVRVVRVRIGVVLSARGGALQKMLFPFRCGLGGRVGHGHQYWSWIALDDLVSVIHHAIDCEQVSGPVNAVAPNPVTNREFTHVLGRVLRRPTIFPMPRFAARIALGEMADELLLASARVSSSLLEASGYEFRFSELEDALRHELGAATET